MEQGLIHIYTGDGKGKTTTSVGLSVRALSKGLKVCYCGFNKRWSKHHCMEADMLEKLGAKIMCLTDEHPRFNKKITLEQHKSATTHGFEKIKQYIKQNDCDLLVIDELNISVRDGFIDEDHVIDFLNNKPFGLEVVITGRGATNRLIELADYVSVIQAHKHPYEKGITSREGIEF